MSGAANGPVSGLAAGPPWVPVPRPASGWPGNASPGMPVPGTLSGLGLGGMGQGGMGLGGMTAADTALPDVSEVLDEAFGARRD